MSPTIFVRERRKVQQGEKKPRFRIVGISGGDLKIYPKHIRKQELEEIATTISAKIVMLRHGKDGTGKSNS
jgi:hypothetical protein